MQREVTDPPVKVTAVALLARPLAAPRGVRLRA
jgi:hypothetical protein